MESNSNSQPTDQKHHFDLLIRQCYNMGKRLRDNPPFHPHHVLQYKAKCYKQAKGPPREVSTAISGTHHFVESAPRRVSYLDDSLAPAYPYGSKMYNFFHSWPSKVSLKFDESDMRWSENVDNHCPFCKPKGKVKTLKELLDHLATHHPQFTYKPPPRSGTVIAIKMSINYDRENNVDPMHVFGAEGYMLSSSMRCREPTYCDVPLRSNAGYPFSVRMFKVPEEYGGYIPGAPGTIDAESTPESHPTLRHGTEIVPHAAQSRRTVNLRLPLRPPAQRSPTAARNFGASSRNPRNKAIRATPERNVASNGRTEYVTEELIDSSEMRRKATPRKTAQYVPNRSWRRLRNEFEGVHVASSRRTEYVTEELIDCSEMRRKATPRKTAQYVPNRSRRRLRNEVEEMPNSQAAHMPVTMLGTNAARQYPVRADGKAIISEEAANGHLFQTVTNVPLDIRRCNEGLDSDDNGEEERIRCQLRRKQLRDREDLSAIEKAFVNLWQEHASRNAASRGDKDIIGLLMRFIKTYGEELRQLNVEACLASLTCRLWELGLLDTDGLMVAFQTFRDLGAAGTKDILGMESEAMASTYMGLRGMRVKSPVDSSHVAWLAEELRKCVGQKEAREMALEGMKKMDGWMATMFERQGER